MRSVLTRLLVGPFLLARLLAVLFSVWLAVSAEAGVIDFENTTLGTNRIFQGGFEFVPGLLLDTDFGFGFADGAASSGTHFASSTLGPGIGVIRQDGNPFDFNGAWFSAFLGPRVVVLRGYRAGSDDASPDFTAMLTAPDSQFGSKASAANNGNGQASFILYRLRP